MKSSIKCRYPAIGRVKSLGATVTRYIAVTAQFANSTVSVHMAIVFVCVWHTAALYRDSYIVVAGAGPALLQGPSALVSGEGRGNNR